MNARALQLIANLLAALLVIVLGLQLAWWTWQFVVPSWRTPMIDSVGTAATVPPSLGRQLFGDRDASPAVGAPNVNSSERLKGVFAVDGKTLSAAVVNLGKIGSSNGDAPSATRSSAIG